MEEEGVLGRMNGTIVDLPWTLLETVNEASLDNSQAVTWQRFSQKWVDDKPAGCHAYWLPFSRQGGKPDKSMRATYRDVQDKHLSKANRQELSQKLRDDRQ